MTFALKKVDKTNIFVILKLEYHSKLQTILDNQT